MRFITLIIVLLTTTGCVFKDYALKQSIIKENMVRYEEKCPCPYILDSAGRECGERSAYSKGKNRLCYHHQFTEEFIENYKKKHGIKSDE